MSATMTDSFSAAVFAVFAVPTIFADTPCAYCNSTDESCGAFDCPHLDAEEHDDAP